MRQVQPNADRYESFEDHNDVVFAWRYYQKLMKLKQMK